MENQAPVSQHITAPIEDLSAMVILTLLVSKSPNQSLVNAKSQVIWVKVMVLLAQMAIQLVVLPMIIALALQ
jgi:hypothetical protein